VKRIIFVAGTDTGVGKTVLTAMLLVHLRSRGCNALAMKPFCSGSRGDARLLHSLQKEYLTLDTVNPFYFDKPLAPAAAPKPAAFRNVLAKIEALAERCEVLLVEGAGGLLAPLGKNYTARDLISALRCQTIIVARNRLGVINHTLLTVESLQETAQENLAVVLMGVKNPDLSATSNPEMLRKRMPGINIFSIPNLDFSEGKRDKLKINALFLKKTLAQILQVAILMTFFFTKK
jgi:dethiobiotin synthetase